MKPLLFLCLFIINSSLAVRGQGFNGFSYVDNKALSIPEAKTYSSDSIAGFIKSNFKTDPEKIRGIYAWVTKNIRYDKDSMYPINWSLEHEEKISATLRRRRGVCENYASLFTDIAVKSGIQSFVVNGYTRVQSNVDRSGHSWCAVNLQQEWFLCDPTWDNESGSNSKYFLISPSEFIETHIPFDPLWQLLEYPLMQHEFSKGIFHSKKDRPVFHFADSVRAFLQLDSLQQLEASTRRIVAAGIENERQKYWLAYNQMKIAGIYGENYMTLYNSAVADLNKANIAFNSYVQYRNNRFIPAKPDNEINALLDPIARLILSASKKLDQIGKGTDNFQYDTGTIKNRLTGLTARVNEEKIFVKNYLGTAVPERERLFYK